MERKSFDVCVVGAGPAGATAACRLAERGIDALLVDRAHFPRDKVCGDGVGPRAVRVLEKLGLYPSEGFPGGYGLEGIRIGSPNRRVLEVRVGEGVPESKAGYVIPRERFDGWLLEQAVKKGVRLWDGMEVRQIEKRKGALRLSGSRDGRPLSVTARFAVGAWGAQAGKVAGPYPARVEGGRFAVIAMRGYFKGLQGIGPYLEIHFDPGLVPGYGWVFPMGPESANIGYGIRQDFLRKKGIPLRRLFEEFLGTNPSVRRYLEKGERVSPLRGAVIPFRKALLPVTHGRLLRTGDAAAFADPLSGEGIGTAMQSGWMAADCVANALEHGTPARLATVAYAASCHKEIVWNLGLASLVQSILIRPPFGSTDRILDAFVDKAQGNPRMARAMARLIIGDLSRAAFLDVRNWAKLLQAWRQK
jgi:geranylgeranyl reductase family protein